mmetsp:Transcript_22213/g.69350  ORF Transcript_22213/g.69350 Transcript_22213/m.69350 type:complete len:327 (+) Transcript_22213:457-1437(+)
MALTSPPTPCCTFGLFPSWQSASSACATTTRPGCWAREDLLSTLFLTHGMSPSLELLLKGSRSLSCCCQWSGRRAPGSGARSRVSSAERLNSETQLKRNFVPGNCSAVGRPVRGRQEDQRRGPAEARAPPAPSRLRHGRPRQPGPRPAGRAARRGPAGPWAGSPRPRRGGRRRRLASSWTCPSGGDFIMRSPSTSTTGVASRRGPSSLPGPRRRRPRLRGRGRRRRCARPPWAGGGRRSPRPERRGRPRCPEEPPPASTRRTPRPRGRRDRRRRCCRPRSRRSSPASPPATGGAPQTRTSGAAAPIAAPAASPRAETWTRGATGAP